MNLSTVRITGHQDIKMNVSGPFGSCLCTSALIPSRWWTRSRKPRRLTLPLSSESLWQSKSKCIQEWTKTQDHVMNSREQGRRRKRKRTAIDYIIYSSVHVRKKKQEDIYIEQGHLINHQGYLCNTPPQTRGEDHPKFVQESVELFWRKNLCHHISKLRGGWKVSKLNEPL